MSSPANRSRANPQLPLTARQIKAIRAGVTYLRWDDAEYRAQLARYRVKTGGDRQGQPVASTKELSRAQARQVLAGMQVLGYPVGGPYSGRAPAQGHAVTTMPTPAQRALIERLRDEIPWRTQRGYDAWIASTASPTRGRPIRTYAHAEAVIEGLKALRAKSAQPAHA